jgi:hypothetical protein
MIALGTYFPEKVSEKKVKGKSSSKKSFELLRWPEGSIEC